MAILQGRPAKHRILAGAVCALFGLRSESVLATETAEDQPAARPDGWELVRLHAGLGVNAVAFGSWYDVRVAHPDGRFGAAALEKSRSGYGPSALCGLGIRTGRNRVVGLELEYVRVHAPFSDPNLTAIEAPVMPWTTHWQLGVFVDKHFQSGWLFGVALGYARIAERFDSRAAEPCCVRKGSYSVTTWVGHGWPLTEQLLLDLSIRLSVVDFSPFGLPLAIGEGLVNTALRSARAGLATRVSFR